MNDTVVRLRFPRRAAQNFLRMHFVTDPLPNLLKTGNWIAYAFYTWTCSDHNCGIDQINITSKDFGKDGAAFQRLDARYDWLPSPVSRLGNKTVKLVYAGYGCREITTNVAGCVALVLNGTCSYYQKVLTMQKMGAKAVLVMASYGLPLEDMQCHGSECDDTLQIPAAMIPYNFKLIMADSPMVRYHHKPCNNFFTGVDRNGKLAEVGWFLYPSFQFFVWQAEWFDYMYGLVRNVTIKPSMLIPVLDHTTMQGKKGAVATVIIPSFTDLQRYGLVQLDMSLDCPGKKDESCPHWDHTVQLYVCCDNTSALCGMELGRWISPFRRRIGRWLTDITPLIPLLASQTVTQCNFTMKTAPWAMAWVPSLRLRLSHVQESKGQAPADILPLFTVGATFDKSYNSHWKPVTTAIPSYAKKVVLVAVITGHGSDNNGCGEFCVTSHHFTVNNKTWSVTFTNAGTPLGCANRVPMGVEPNEHGTWLYGRDGWCDGNEIDPIIFDLTAVAPPNEKVIISYRGTYNNTDPKPTHSPGYITLYSYLTIYKVV